VAHMGHHTRAV